MRKMKRFDYANDVDFAEVLERYGGEEYLKEKFPRILQMLLDSREYHRLLAHEKATKNFDKVADGHQDDFGITLLPIKNSTVAQQSVAVENDLPSSCGICSVSHMSLKDPHPMIIMTGSIRDSMAGKTFSSFSCFDVEAQKLKDERTIDHRYLTYTNQPTVNAETNFTAFDKVNGQSVCVVDQTNISVISIKEMESVVTKIEVLQPCSKKATDLDIRIVYSREDKDAAYSFKSAKADGSLVNVFFPFHIRVTLNEAFEFNPSQPTERLQDAYIRLASSVVLGGAVHFEYYHRENIKTEVNGNVLEVDFKYVPKQGESFCETDKNYWGTNMTLGAKEISGFFDFHINFGIHYGVQGTGKYDQKSDIIVSSEELPASDNFVKIKVSKIIWGCLGKNTMLRTERGYVRIDQIQPGEMIYTDKGYIKFKNMVIGVEEKIIAVGVEGREVLFITSEHPIASERGVIRATDLLVTDKLRMEDGTFQSINNLETIDYNDKVYSPELEEPALISANGFMVGDYLTPAQEVDAPVKKCASLDPGLIEELKEWQAMKSE